MPRKKNLKMRYYMDFMLNFAALFNGKQKIKVTTKNNAYEKSIFTSYVSDGDHDHARHRYGDRGI